MKKTKLFGAIIATSGGLAAVSTLFCGALSLNKSAEQNITITWNVDSEAKWGTIGGSPTTEITKPTKFYDLNLPTTTPDTGAHFEGWFINGIVLNPNSIIDPAEYPSGVTILAKFYPTIEDFRLTPNVITIDKAENPENPGADECYPITLNYVCHVADYTPTFAWTVDKDSIIGLKESESVSNETAGKRVYGKAVGDAKITVSYDIGSIHKEVTCAVHVSDTPIMPEKLTVTAKGADHDLDVGFEDVEMEATITPAAASQDVTWSSSNDKIATVDATTGVVSSPASGGKPGVVIISAKSQVKDSIVGFWTFNVHSAFIPVAKVEFKDEPADKPIDIQVGGTHQLKAYLSGEEGAEPTYKSIQWVVEGDPTGQHIKVGIDGLITATNTPTSESEHIFVKAVSHGGSGIEEEVEAVHEVRVLGDAFKLNVSIKSDQSEWGQWFEGSAPVEAGMGQDVKLELSLKDPRTVIKEAKATLGETECAGKIEKNGSTITVTFNKEFFYGTTESIINISLAPEKHYNVTYELAGEVKSASTQTAAIVGQDTFVVNFSTTGTALQLFSCHVYADGEEIPNSITSFEGSQLTVTKLSTKQDATNIVVHLDTTENPEYATITIADGDGIKTYIDENLGAPAKRITLYYDIDNLHYLCTEAKASGGMYITIDGTDYEFGSSIWSLDTKEKKVAINMESIATENPVVVVHMNTKENQIHFDAAVSGEGFKNPSFELDSYELGQDFTFYWLLADNTWVLDDDAAKDFYEVSLTLSTGKTVIIRGGYVSFEPSASDPTRVKTTIEWNPLWETYTITEMIFHAAAVQK